MNISEVKVGDKIKITPIDRLPNFDRGVIEIQSVNENSFGYGATETCDGYEYPFYAIKEIERR